MGNCKNGIESEEKKALYKYVWLHFLLHHGWEKLGLQVTAVKLAEYVVSLSLSRRGSDFRFGTSVCNCLLDRFTFLQI